MLQETRITINEDLLLQVIVKLEMFQMQRKAIGYDDNGYSKEIKTVHDEVEKIWMQMETNKNYRLFEEL